MKRREFLQLAWLAPLAQTSQHRHLLRKLLRKLYNLLADLI